MISGSSPSPPKILPEYLNATKKTAKKDARTKAYFKAQASAPISRHHALCDARALRVAYEAARRVPVEPGQSNLPLDGHKHRTIAA